MPNHCANRLTIRGRKTQLEAFLKAFSHKDENDGTMYYIYLQKFKEELTKMYTRIGGKVPDKSSVMGMLWTPWGTKWGCYEFLEPVWSHDKLVLTFKTAWGPYNGMAQVFMSQQFPTLKFHLDYAESGQCFVGHHDAVGGRMVSSAMEEVYKTGKVILEDLEDGGQEWVWEPEYEKYHDLWAISG